MGEIVGAFGVRGWIKVRSYTEPPENILKYSPWFIAERGGPKQHLVLEGRPHGQAIIARLEGLTDRERAMGLKGSAISVSRECFPAPEPGQFYWADLMDLRVHTVTGLPLGRVVNMIETGANDVLEVEGSRKYLIPFVVGEFIKEVRLDQGVLIVDWDPDF